MTRRGKTYGVRLHLGDREVPGPEVYWMSTARQPSDPVYTAAIPASIEKQAPVTYRPSSDARNKTILEMSHGSSQGTPIRDVLAADSGAKSSLVGTAMSGQNAR